MWMIIHQGEKMKTIQMTIDEQLLERVDLQVIDLQMTRSAFIREALEQALQAYAMRRLEEKDEIGYRAIPARIEESEEWLSEQDWGDKWNAPK
jgi:metal-responsive CopG/Arc/MetJ family transcriptional regulator